MNVEPIILKGRYVRLEPLSLRHLPDLSKVGLDPELWRWTPSQVSTVQEMEAYIRAALEGQAAGSTLPFATVDKDSERTIGSTRFMNIDRDNRRVEIGSTWIAPAWQRTAVNTEAKLLMMQHAFETWRCIRVELKTDLLNERSRQAILRLGALEEGTLRNHMITSTGRIRHTVYYSVIESEWPVVKRNLQNRLEPAGSPPSVKPG
ncbi:MAG: GNAT family protein [Acidobacteriota bacterium]